MVLLSRHIILYISLSTILLMSCRTVKEGQIYQNLEANEIEAGILEDEELIIEVAYIGAIGHSFVFECAVTNLSNRSIFIDKSQFRFTMNGKRILKPIQEEEIVSDLIKESKSIKKRRKADTAIGILGVGLNVLLGASSGLSVGESLLTNAEPVVYIMDDRRWYNQNIESVEDEIAYVRSAQFDNQMILPDDTIVRDILFPTIIVEGDIDFSLHYNDEVYIITFPQNIFK